MRRRDSREAWPRGAPSGLGVQRLELFAGSGHFGLTVVVLEASPGEVVSVSNTSLCFVVSDPLV